MIDAKRTQEPASDCVIADHRVLALGARDHRRVLAAQTKAIADEMLAFARCGPVSALSGCGLRTRAGILARSLSASGDLRCDLVCDQRELLLLVVERPQVDALASRIGVV